MIEDLDLLLDDLREKIARAKDDYLAEGSEGQSDERLEKVIYGRFLDPEPPQGVLRGLQRD